jgi:hypothetical protein
VRKILFEVFGHDDAGMPCLQASETIRQDVIFASALNSIVWL